VVKQWQFVVQRILQGWTGPGLSRSTDAECQARGSDGRTLWRLARADGSTGDISIDFGEVDAAGMLTKIAGFFGEPPKE
jgi:hypothetical protein